MRHKGLALIEDPRTNKSTAFTEEERKKLGIEGLVPNVTESEELQLKRVMMQLSHKKSDMDRYIYLTQLLDHNEVLFYRTVMSDPARFLPIIYDPTIGEACLKYDHVIRHPRGMYLSMEHKGRVKEVLSNWPEKDIRVICVTNGGRILGLGDLGANGMPIPIGKLQLYTAAAGVPPQHLLPLYLDSGTDNEELRNDPFYLGHRAPRPPTEKLNAFVDEFVEAVQELFPLCCIHFEDWTGKDAVHLLERYRDKVCCYNDDIQGTAGITLAGIYNALKMKQEPLKEQRILLFGAGSAGIGIANLIASAMQEEGLSADQARANIHLFDVNGLLEASRTDLFDFQIPYAHQTPPSKSLLESIKRLKPSIIIGVSTVGGTFTQEVVETMCSINERPIIFALSNPTQKAECTAEQAYQWSRGKALYAAGVQFPNVELEGKTFMPGQANNFYLYPALGMAVFASQATRVTDEMFIEGAKAIADLVTPDELAKGLIFPLQSNILEAEIKTAARIAAFVFERGLARAKKPDDFEAWIRSHVFNPTYKSLL